MASGGLYPHPSTLIKLLLCREIRARIIGRLDAQRSHPIFATLIQLWLTQFDRGG